MIARAVAAIALMLLIFAAALTVAGLGVMSGGF